MFVCLFLIHFLLYLLIRLKTKNCLPKKCASSVECVQNGDTHLNIDCGLTIAILATATATTTFIITNCHHRQKYFNRKLFQTFYIFYPFHSWSRDERDREREREREGKIEFQRFRVFCSYFGLTFSCVITQFSSMLRSKWNQRLEISILLGCVFLSLSVRFHENDCSGTVTPSLINRNVEINWVYQMSVDGWLFGSI